MHDELRVIRKNSPAEFDNILDVCVTPRAGAPGVNVQFASHGDDERLFPFESEPTDEQLDWFRKGLRDGWIEGLKDGRKHEAAERAKMLQQLMTREPLA